MTDKELLEYAAKAAGLNVQRSRMEDPLNKDFLINGSSPRNEGQKTYPWNPLTDDGDALRLAVKCKIDANHGDNMVVAELVYEDGIGVAEPYLSDPYAATRRAIVRAAAEIGKQMKS